MDKHDSEAYETEISQFVSSINRETQRRDVISSASWRSHERTLYLWVGNFEKKRASQQQKLAQAAEAAELKGDALIFAKCFHQLKEICIYFPETSIEQPFCYCSDDQLVNVVEDINANLTPLARSSVYQAGVVVSKAVRAHAAHIWGDLSQRYLHRNSFEAEILQKLKHNAIAIDLALTIFSIAASSLQRTSTTEPNPFLDVLGESWFSYSGLELGCIAPLEKYVDGSSHLQDLSAANLALLHYVCFGQPAKLGLLSKDSNDNCITFKVKLPEDPWFEKETKEHGVSKGFHGSNAENFHAILNSGLKNMTHTRKMKNGAIFGEGIYLAADRQVALTFAGSSAQAWISSRFVNQISAQSNSQQSKNGLASSSKKFNYRMVVGCDIIKKAENIVGSSSKHFDKRDKVSDYFTVKRETDVRVTELFLFALDSSLDLQTTPRLARGVVKEKENSETKNGNGYRDSLNNSKNAQQYSNQHGIVMLVIGCIIVFCYYLMTKLINNG